MISIHALREEGDDLALASILTAGEFLSTPSARRATSVTLGLTYIYIISIHALREEGDSSFNNAMGTAETFLSTPSARRATR